jgi:hypothetical protein
MTKEEIKIKYGVQSFRNWSDVPLNFSTRSSAKRQGIDIPIEAKPDAIKNSSSVIDSDKIYLLFDLNKYTP